MIYLIFAILFSASLALALRISETFSDNRYGILVGNYVTCLVVAFVLLPDKNIFAAGSRTAVLTGIVNGFLFTGNLVLMQKCIRENGAVLSSAFAKLGIVIPVTASILFLGEIPTLFQLVGIVLVIVAIWVINSEGDRGCGRRRRMGSAGLLLVLFVVSGMADGMSKVTEQRQIPSIRPLSPSRRRSASAARQNRARRAHTASRWAWRMWKHSERT